VLTIARRHDPTTTVDLSIQGANNGGGQIRVKDGVDKIDTALLPVARLYLRFRKNVGKTVSYIAVLCILLGVVFTAPAMAQGAGPNINFLTPVGLKTTTISYLDSESNFRLGQSDFGELDIQTRTSSLNFFYRFGLLDRLAMLGFTLSHVDINARAFAGGPEPALLLTGGVTGFSDPVLSFRMGLVGTPALQGQAWRDYTQGFQLSVQVNWILPYGDYDASRLLNPGFNRHAVDLVFPMVLPIDGARRTTFLEVTPQARFFGNNNEPFGLAAELEQDPLYIGEIQILHHITGRWWTAVGAQYQNGGATFADGQPRDSALDQWFGEIALGVIVNRRLSLAATYGSILGDANGAEGEAWRLKLGLIL